MKIAISSTGFDLESFIDSRFGRCLCFVIYDSETRSIEFLPNPNRENSEGAGPSSAQYVINKGVQLVISGEFGVKVRNIFDSLQIGYKIIENDKTTVSEVIDKILWQD